MAQKQSSDEKRMKRCGTQCRRVLNQGETKIRSYQEVNLHFLKNIAFLLPTGNEMDRARISIQTCELEPKKRLLGLGYIQVYGLNRREKRNEGNEEKKYVNKHNCLDISQINNEW